MQLIPIKQHPEENEEFINNPACRETIHQTIDFYKKVGFVPPWIGYYAEEDGTLVAAAGFKGPPVNGTIEIAYGTFEEYQQQGFGTKVCKQLVDLSLTTDPSIQITARTLPEENPSTRILRKNNFELMGTVNDPEDGDVWEWLFKHPE
ncbi:MAG: GNAT family protein [Bacteroidota bacterium]